MSDASVAEARRWDLQKAAGHLASAAKLTWWLGLLAFIAGVVHAFMSTKTLEQALTACITPVLGMLGTNAISLVLKTMALIADGVGDLLYRAYKLDKNY